MSSNSDHQVRAALYDDFQDFIVSSVRNRENPTLCLKAYDMVKQNTDSHLEVVLENVDNASREMYEKIEEGFRPGTKMKTREMINGGAPVFYVYIPLKNKKTSSSVASYFGGKSSSSKKKRRQPSQNMLMLYIIGFCSLIIFSVLKTSAVEWRQIPGFPF